MTTVRKFERRTHPLPRWRCDDAAAPSWFPPMKSPGDTVHSRLRNRDWCFGIIPPIDFDTVGKFSMAHFPSILFTNLHRRLEGFISHHRRLSIRVFSTRRSVGYLSRYRPCSCPAQYRGCWMGCRGRVLPNRHGLPTLGSVFKLEFVSAAARHSRLARGREHLCRGMRQSDDSRFSAQMSNGSTSSSSCGSSSSSSSSSSSRDTMTQAVDMVRELLLYRGFGQTLRCLEAEMAADRSNGGMQVGGLCRWRHLWIQGKTCELCCCLSTFPVRQRWVHNVNPTRIPQTTSAHGMCSSRSGPQLLSFLSSNRWSLLIPECLILLWLPYSSCSHNGSSTLSSTTSSPTPILPAFARSSPSCAAVISPTPPAHHPLALRNLKAPRSAWPLFPRCATAAARK